MNLIFTVFHLALLFCVFSVPCSEKKSTERAYQQLHEKRISDYMKLDGMNQSLAPLFANPRNDLQLKQKAKLEKVPCLDEIKFEKERLRDRVNSMLDTTSQEDLLAYCPAPDDESLEMHATCIAKNIVVKKNNRRPKKNETDKQYTERVLEAELKRFIVPTASHKVSHRSSLPSLESSSVTIIEPAENPADIITDEYYEYRDLVKEQEMQTAQHQPLFACFFQQCSHCCVIQ